MTAEGSAEPRTGRLRPAPVHAYSEPLDRAVDAQLPQPGRPWLTAAVCSVLVIPVLVTVLSVFAWLGLPAPVTTVVGNLMLIGMIVAVGRPVARIAGGWNAAVGLDRPRRVDVRPALGGLVRQIVARFGAAAVVAVVLSLAAPDGHAPISNIDGVQDLSGLSQAGVAVAAVVLAPIAEEIAFRGLVLRALMRRLPFQWAAVISSVLFGALHSVQGGTVTAGVALAFFTAVFGYVQCLIVRGTGRLAPAMLVHGVSNGLQLALVII